MTTARDMVTIPGGRFVMGLTEGEADALARELVAMEVTLLGERQHLKEPVVDVERRTRERREALIVSMPAHEVDVSEFAIDRFPVTVGEYARYAARTGARTPDRWKRGRPSDDVFVTGLSWQEARDFAAHHGLALATEIEWERASRDDRRFFTWGSSYFPQGRLAFPETGSNLPWQVGSRPELASPWGVHDMLGEFGELTEDALAPYPGADVARFTRQFPQWRDQRAIRGGFDVDRDSTCIYRNGIAEMERANDIKFRCVHR
jgi:formylglycine-generating enzyme required for sulfatase activity